MPWTLRIRAFTFRQVQCSAHLKFFLCTVYAPVCTVINEPIPPCRSLCLQVRRGCENLMNRFGFQWPENLDCSLFPDDSVTSLCVGHNITESGGGGGVSTTPLPSGQRPAPGVPRGGGPPSGPFFTATPTRRTCPVKLRVPASFGYHVELNDQVKENCCRVDQI